MVYIVYLFINGSSFRYEEEIIFVIVFVENFNSFGGYIFEIGKIKCRFVVVGGIVFEVFKVFFVDVVVELSGEIISGEDIESFFVGVSFEKVGFV